jgi:DNA repair protein RecN (Recombination protein N)
LIRAGAENAYVEALFDISDCPNVRKTLYDMYEDNESDLLISREISAVGRNVCRINGRMATLSQLSQITNELIDIHGQHEHQSLLNPKNHISVLDAFCKKELALYMSDYKGVYKEYNLLTSRIKALETDDYEKQRRLDMLNFQFNEIEAMSLQPGEEDSLRTQRDVLQHAEKIRRNVETSYDAFYGDGEMFEGIIGILTDIKKHIGEIAGMSDEYNELSARMESLLIEGEDIAGEIRTLKFNESYTEGDLDYIEGRISDINKLKRKYGSTVEEILEYRASIRKQIDDLEENEFVIEDLLKRKDKTYLELKELANRITDVRSRKSEELSRNIIDQLSHLGMERAEFDVKITRKESAEGLVFYPNGSDDVEFMISTNPGEPLKPLNRIASGGEISRIMLALKTISSESDKIATVIFDEIDTGISGKMASVVAQKLSTIAVNHQVICVTHTAQIAAMADVHHFIEKQMDESRAKTEVSLLSEKERYMEVSRLVGGNNISQFSDAHAKEIIEWSNDFKKEMKNNL